MTYPQTTPRASYHSDNKRKGLLLALLLHGGIVAMFVYPFFLAERADHTTCATVVELDFHQNTPSAAEGDVARVARGKVAASQARRTPASEQPQPASAQALAVRAPIPLSQTALLPEATGGEAQIRPETSEPPNQHNSAQSSNATLSSPSPGHGSPAADAGRGNRNAGQGLEGNGILRRAVVYRPEMHSLVRQNGTIAMNVCVNQSGTVVGVKWNEARSTITDTDLIREAIAKASDYRFESARDAPRRECGVVSIIVKGLG